MLKASRKVIGFVISLLLALYILLLVVMVVPNLFGFRNFTVTSGSMEPTIPVGSLVYVKHVDYYGISVGDVITYMISQDARVTHRVTDINDSGKSFITKGDNNDTVDAKYVSYDNVVGVVKVHLPYLGYLLNFLSSNHGKLSAICLLLVLIILSEVFSDKRSDGSDSTECNTDSDEVENNESDGCDTLISADINTEIKEAGKEI